MSRYIFNTQHESRPVQVVIGWDRPLQGYFMNIARLDYEPPPDDADEAALDAWESPIADEHGRLIGRPDLT